MKATFELNRPPEVGDLLDAAHVLNDRPVDYRRRLAKVDARADNAPTIAAETERARCCSNPCVPHFPLDLDMPRVVMTPVTSLPVDGTSSSDSTQARCRAVSSNRS